MINKIKNRIICFFKCHEKECSVCNLEIPLEVNSWCKRCDKPLFNK